MACFLVPAAEAIAVSVAKKGVEAREEHHTEVSIPLSRKLRWLSRLLWGGAVLLGFEHLWHGEITPWFPFLTAMADREDAAAMFHEMATVGVAMALLISVVWVGMCLAADAVVRRQDEGEEIARGGAV